MSKSDGGPWSGFSTRAEGAQGGWSSPANRAFILSGGSQKEITQPHVPVNLKHGDKLLTLSGGGAGVGKPDERDPQAVSLDVRNELVSAEMARKVYRVALKKRSWEVDIEATKRLRKKTTRNPGRRARREIGLKETKR